MRLTGLCLAGVAGFVCGPALGEPLRDDRRLLIDRERELHRHGALSRARTRFERRHVEPRALERFEHAVGDPEDAAVVAPARHEAVGLRRTGAGERAGEGVEVVGAGSPPPVDRLVRVADGHHRGVAEEFREEPGLDDRCVLILVEQHDTVLLAELVADVGSGLDDVVGTAHLVGEVEHAAALLLGDVVAHEARQRRQTEEVHRRLLDIAVAAIRLEGEGLIPRDALSEIEVDTVVEGVTGQPLHGIDDRAERELDVLQLGRSLRSTTSRASIQEAA